MHPAEQLRYFVLAAQREGNRKLLELLRPLEVTPSQAEVLRVVGDHGPLSLVDLGGLLICETGSPSRLVDGLVSAKLLGRVPAKNDRRRVVLTLTDAGHQKESQVREVEAGLYAHIDSLISESDISTVNRVLADFIAGSPVGASLSRRNSGTRPPREEP